MKDQDNNIHLSHIVMNINWKPSQLPVSPVATSESSKACSLKRYILEDTTDIFVINVKHK